MLKRFGLLALVAVSLGGCSLPFANKNVVQKVEEKTVEQAVLQNCKYDKDVCQYYAAMVTAYKQPMTIKTTTPSKEDGTMISTTKMDGKGNITMISTRGGKEESAMIILDSVTYFKDLKDNSWYKMTPNKEQSSLFNIQETIDEFKKEAEDTSAQMKITKLGEEACGTLTCMKYQIEQPEMKTAETVWFDTKEYKTRKMETTYAGTTSTMEYGYGEAVAITTPSPVKDMPDYSKMMEQNGVKMPSAADLQKMMEQVPQGGDEGSGE